MNTHKEYDVLRLIEHNRICYVSSDNVKGMPLVIWVKYHPFLSKRQMLQWIYDIVKQLLQIHKCRGNPCYQYVNPYSIIVTEDQRLCFLDISAESNKDNIRAMQRRNIREHFLPEGSFCHNQAENTDIYGLGKTLQYILAFVEVEPGFTKNEERKLQKIISRCIDTRDRKKYENVSEVYQSLNELRIG